ncbi:MAG: DUF488 domain-containing protein [Thermodesulfobacteriaceae bacterium]|nr:DUF488 domain-containing protein [Thermodesulfobacteriaceae bacterium]MCX8041846.1 DUF488 domain-containing protein [Thermodesulfobacteriaceae bacterium]MDW8136784.1 DUF488 domain-containing protein [Thermodesulfobacterium sp.]
MKVRDSFLLVYTLGTSNRSLEEFLEILKYYQILAIADVRRWPVSQRFPHFKKENLSKFLKENNILYYHLEGLGGYRREDYENYMETENFLKVLEELIKIIKNRLTCIICAERFPWKCHRRFISLALEKRGIRVLHILEKERIWEPKG